MADQDKANPDKNKQLDEIIKALKNLDKSLSFLKDFEKKKDRATTPGSRWTRKHDKAYLESLAKQEKQQSAVKRIQDKFQWEQRRIAYKQLKALSKTGQASSYNKDGTPRKNATVMPQLGALKKFNAQMKNIATMINPKGVDKKKVANESANAMKGVMKFAVGGSIVGMLGKKLFDSSPLLKTMMSLFNTSIMLIFRPIGDFIGSFLRPIMLFFMKNIAIPFYKNSKHAMGLGEQMGKKALGFLLKPIETIHAAIVMALANSGLAPLLGEDTVNRARDYSGIHAWQLEQGEKMGIISSEMGEEIRKGIDKIGWQPFKKSIDYLYSGGILGGGGSAQQGITVTGVSTPAQDAFQEEAEKVVDIFKGGNSELVELEKLFVDMVESGEFSKEQVDLIADAMRRSVLAGNSIENAFVGILTGLDKMAKEIAQKAQSYYEQRQNDPGIGSRNKNTQRGKDIMTAAENFLNGKVTYSGGDWGMGGVPKPTISKSYSNPQAQIIRAQEVQRNLNKQKSATFYGQYSDILSDYTARTGRFAGKSDHEASQLLEALTRGGMKGKVGDAGQRLLNDVTNAISFGKVKDPNDKEARLRAQKFEASLQMWKNLGINSLGTKIKPQMGDLVTGKGAIGYANGGLITEPIFGIGRSGQTYTFGERGQETVVPGKGGVNHILNINIGNISSDTEYQKLKTLVQRWTLEANSRRGII